MNTTALNLLDICNEKAASIQWQIDSNLFLTSAMASKGKRHHFVMHFLSLSLSATFLSFSLILSLCPQGSLATNAK